MGSESSRSRLCSVLEKYIFDVLSRDSVLTLARVRSASAGRDCPLESRPDHYSPIRLDAHPLESILLRPSLEIRRPVDGAPTGSIQISRINTGPAESLLRISAAPAESMELQFKSIGINTAGK
jgi:hypothetical protein